MAGGDRLLRDATGAVVDRTPDRDLVPAFTRWLQRHAYLSASPAVPDDLAAIARVRCSA